MIDKESCINFGETDQKKVSENTIFYLENYLNPHRTWDKKITPKERINQIRYADVDWKTICKHIKGMDYHNFLKTPYWKAIAAHTKYKAGYKCQLCNSPHNLITHHRNYGIHGFEHAHMQELTVICNKCHNRFHEQTHKLKINPRPISTTSIIKSMKCLGIVVCVFGTIIINLSYCTPHQMKQTSITSETASNNLSPADRAISKFMKRKSKT